MVTTDKKGWRITLLIVLIAGATYAEKVVDVFFEKHGPHLRLHDTPTRVEQLENGIKIFTDISLINDGDRAAINVLPVTSSYVNGELISSSPNDYKITIDAGEAVHMPLIIEVGNDVWDGKSRLTLTLVAPYEDGTAHMPQLKKRWEFNPNTDNDLAPAWAVMQWEE